jgi:hypothetical protein
VKVPQELQSAAVVLVRIPGRPIARVARELRTNEGRKSIRVARGAAQAEHGQRGTSDNNHLEATAGRVHQLRMKFLETAVDGRASVTGRWPKQCADTSVALR